MKPLIDKQYYHVQWQKSSQGEIAQYDANKDQFKFTNGSKCDANVIYSFDTDPIVKGKVYSESELKSFAMHLLTSLMPKEVTIPDAVTDITSAIEFGMKKQEDLERLVYLRAIGELDTHIEKYNEIQRNS